MVCDIKIVFIGDSSTGKTSFIQRLLDGYFSHIVKATISNNLKIFKLKDGRQIEVHVWDTVGMEAQHNSLTNGFFTDVDGVFIFYTIDDKLSFENVKTWNSKLEFKEPNPNLVKVLIGSKSDLKENREVKEDTGEHQAKSINAKFFETSAKENQNIKESFEYMVNSIYEKIITTQPSRLNRGNNNNGTKYERKCCSFQ